jgi:hypothetical protein
MLNIIHAANHQQHGAHSSDADKQLPSEVSQSLNYQILRCALMASSQVPAPQAARAQTIGAAATASAAATTFAAVVQSHDFVRVIQQRELKLELNVKPAPEQTDPLTLELAGNRMSTRSLSDSLSAAHDGDDQQEQISAPSGDYALLGRNANGRIDHGGELSGNQHGACSGFAELNKYDDRGDLQDSVWAHLSLLRFTQHGQRHSQSLSAVGVNSIDLQAQNAKQALGAYDEIAQLGHFEFTDGRSDQAADLLLVSH